MLGIFSLNKHFTSLLYTGVGKNTTVCGNRPIWGGFGLCCSAGGLGSEYTQIL